METEEDKKCVLVIDDSKTVVELISIYIEANYECKVEKAFSGFEGIEQIKILKDRLIGVISDYNMPEGTGGDVYHYLKSNNVNLSFMLVSAENLSTLEEFKNFPSKNTEHYLVKPFSPREIENKLVLFFGNSVKREEAVEYRKVQSEMLTKYLKAQPDVFIRLKSGKFVQISRRDQVFDPDYQVRLKEKGVEYFYLNTNDFESFYQNSMNEIQKVLDSPKAAISARIEAQLDSFEAISSSMGQMGLKADVVATAEKSIQATIAHLSKNKQISRLLKLLLSGKTYRSKLSLLSGYMATSIAMNTDWGGPQTFHKLNMASIFQDSALSIERLASVKCRYCPDFDALDESDKKLVLEHPEASAKIFMEVATDEDVKNIILNHHERPLGDGFPKSLNYMEITPIYAVFIIAHEFAHRVIQDGVDPQTMAKLKSEFDTQYNKGNFRKAFQGFTKSFSEF